LNVVKGDGETEGACFQVADQIDTEGDNWVVADDDSVDDDDDDRLMALPSAWDD
jgi:hypothetical protein